MPLPKLIRIVPGSKGGNARFDPATLAAVAGDVITWSNTDPKIAHWPILTAIKTAAGKVDQMDPNYFTPNTIAPGTTSNDFRPGDTETTTLYYRCSTHPKERGQIVVEPAGAPHVTG